MTVRESEAVVIRECATRLLADDAGTRPGCHPSGTPTPGTGTPRLPAEPRTNDQAAPSLTDDRDPSTPPGSAPP